MANLIRHIHLRHPKILQGFMSAAPRHHNQRKKGNRRMLPILLYVLNVALNCWQSLHGNFEPAAAVQQKRQVAKTRSQQLHFAT